MRQLLLRIVCRGIPAALILGAMGYLFAELSLLYLASGGIRDPANEDIRWKVPLNMALIGLGVLIFLETIAFVIRRKQRDLESENQRATLPE